jgi:hypothetical protein
VAVVKGMENTNPRGLWEKLKFHGLPTPDPLMATVNACQFIGHEDSLRLACCTKVNGDIEVQTGPELNLFGENFFS